MLQPIHPISPIFSCILANLLLLVLTPFSSLCGQETVEIAYMPDGMPLPKEITDKSYKSYQKGIEWLLQNQNRDGSWGCERAGVPSAAVTGMACLGLMSMGDTPDRGKYAPHLKRALDWMLRICDPRTGRIMANESQTGMGELYGHGTGTLFLAEVYGMSPREDVRAKLTRAIQYICRSQNPDGGWGEGRSDLPITTAMYLALRSARSAGIEVPAQPFLKFEQFVKTCMNPDGGFRQHPVRQAGSMYYPTAAGLRILCGLGMNESNESVRATEYLLKRKLGQDYGGRISEWCFVAAFFASSALMINEGKAYEAYFSGVRDHLVRIQNADGSWTIEYCAHCKAFATALAVCTLQSPFRILPIYQL